MLTASTVYNGMKKLLWHGDACCNTGFGRVTHSVLEHLSKLYDVTVLGINYMGDPHKYPYKIYPAATLAAPDRFGLQRITEIVSEVKPDIFVCLNDIWVANQVYEKFQFVKEESKCKFIGYVPVDSELYIPDMLQSMKFWDVAVTFTKYSGETILTHPDIKVERIAVIPHGVDSSRFKPMDRQEARAKLGIPQDKFIVLNANRNQPRKRIDLTIEAFALFAKDKPDTALYLHMGTKDLGWDVVPLFKQEMARHGLDADKRLILTADNINYTNAPTDEVLNLIYNACDVGVNTSDGEGWGLVSFEHASCRKPQVVPEHTACKDIWGHAGELIKIAAWVRDKDLGVKRGIVNTSDLSCILDSLYFPGGDIKRELYDDAARSCYEVTQRPEYRWENIANGFDSLFNSL
jgi:D-inositol-3-phosphate glycosyltransferase